VLGDLGEIVGSEFDTSSFPKSDRKQRLVSHFCEVWLQRRARLKSIKYITPVAILLARTMHSHGLNH